MILGREICKLFDGININSRAVQTNMGNQDALDKFIAESDKKKSSKYPLIFYVTNKVYRIENDWRFCKTDLILLMNTDSNLLYKERTDKTYVPYIDPLYQMVTELLNREPHLQVFGRTIGEKYPYIDRPNYGIVKGDVGSRKSNKSVVTDYVDARIINLDFKININCINN